MSSVADQSSTFLFTDIEGSTRLWERHPEAMGPVIARQEQILRAAVGMRGGVVFNTAGDGVCAVFPDPSQAVAAAIDAQHALTQEPWETYAPGLRILVRMAVDRGAAVASGENYVGPVLNRLHRLMKTGHGGQILCTDAIGAEELGPDLQLRDLGSHPLRDISEDLRLFQIVAPGLPATFAPLITERSLPRRLPLPPVTLFGREQALVEIDALLRDRTTRLATLLGPGGVGKTSLALALGRQLFDFFPDGVHFVDLSALRDVALVVPTIASALEIEDPLLNQDDALIAQLKQRALLLILDNCEQVADGVAKVTRRLIGETHSVTVLVTSRVPLRLRGEQEVHVEPLPTHFSHNDLTINPAVQLFADRARHVNLRFTLSESTQPAVEEICRLLDGLPLAIELAAAWIRVLDPLTLQNRLVEGAPLLKSDTRDRPERHRTLASTIDWSYQLLTLDAQWAFGRLSVFRGGVPIDGALAVLQEGNRFGLVESLELIDTLVQANLLQTPTQTTDGPRYLMLQTIQEFGLSALSSDERVAAHRAHAAYFSAMASSAEDHYRGPEAATWFDRLDANVANLQETVLWLATANGGNPDTALQMATALNEFLDIRNRYLEARLLLTTTIEHAPDAPAALRARALAQLGNSWLTNYEQAETFYRRALDTAAEDPADDWQMTATLGLSSIALMRGEYDRSLSIARAVLDRCRAGDDPGATAQALLVLGQQLDYAGKPEAAFDPLDESIALSQQIGDLAGVAWAHRVQALALLSLGELERSEQLLRQSILEFESMGERIMVAFCQLDLIRVLIRTDGQHIVELLTAAASEILPSVDVFMATAVLDTGAAVLLRAGEPEISLQLLGASEAWRTSTGTVLPAFVRAEVQATLDDATLRVEPDSARQALARGCALSLRDAMQNLQQQLNRLAVHAPDSAALTTAG